MKRWLLLLVLVGIFVILSWFKKNRMQKRFPILQRIDRTIKLAAWIIIIIYILAILYWLF